MREYIVSFDFLIEGRWHAHSNRVTASSAKAACKIIKDNYWGIVNRYVERGYSTASARRKVHYPFHLTAKRAE